MISVVVPAHNEAGVIRAFIARLAPAAEAGELELVVVCNGCRDDTAAAARAVAGPGVTVLEIETASKAVAMQTGDGAATGFPRFYVDADIGVGPAQLKRLAGALDAPLQAVAPSVVYDLSRSSLAVRAYFRALSQLPAQVSGISGTGCMGLTAEGRARFGEWPAVQADDYFLDGQFASAEKARLTDVSVQVRAPRALSDLARRKMRTLRGNRLVDSLRLRRYAVERGEGLLGIVRAEPRRVGDVAVFAVVALWCRLQLLRRAPAPGVWVRDSSRDG